MKRVLLILLSALVTGCHVPSNVALRGKGGRSAYNTTLQQTGKEQILLNLVRLRFSDTPYFLNVSNITTQFTYDSGLKANFPIPGTDSENPMDLTGTFNWRNSPTISYSPLEGQSFAEQLLKPLDLVILQHLIYSGWDVDRIFRLTVQSFDNSKNVATGAGPIPKLSSEYQRFFKITELMRKLQIQGKLNIGIVTEHNSEENCKRGKSLQILFSSESPDGKELAGLLNGIQRMRGNFVLHTDLGFDEDGEIGIMTRSILSCMSYLSLGIHVPYDLEETANDADVHEEDRVMWGNLVQNLMCVRHSKRFPSNAYVAVPYSGYWFYIPKDDVNSKRTFSLLMGLYNLQSGNSIQTSPILTIPLL